MQPTLANVVGKRIKLFALQQREDVRQRVKVEILAIARCVVYGLPAERDVFYLDGSAVSVRAERG